MLCTGCDRETNPDNMRPSIYYPDEQRCDYCYWSEVDDTEIEGIL